MKRKDIDYILSILLILSIVITGSLGYIQSELELRKFFPHRYAAYTTLCLAAIHIYLNFGKVWGHFLHKYKERKNR